MTRCVPGNTTTPGPRLRSGRRAVARSGLRGLLPPGLRLACLAELVEPAEQLAERRDVTGRPVREVVRPAGAAGVPDPGQPGGPLGGCREHLGAAVLGVGRAVDQTERGEAGHLPAHRALV